MLRDTVKKLLDTKARVVLAIDGCCASGKTTMAAALAAEFSAAVIHADDFFLMPHQRTEARLREVGGNFDYERFKVEVVDALAKGGAFSYRPYDCKRGVLADPVTVAASRLTVVEGCYCMHPYLGTYYDLAVFMSASRELQKARILRRDPRLHRRFFDEWIPMENAYFSAFGIEEKCHVRIHDNCE